nr:reverse transcriptase domain-containing protein [Tanacetum cinerariifolium]
MQEETKKRSSQSLKKVVGDQTADLQYLGTHENNGWRTNVHARLGSRDAHDRLGRWRSLSESPPSSDSEDSRRKRRKRVSSSSSDSSDNEDEETGHWKSRTDTVTRRTKICLVHGVAKRSTRLLGASMIFQKIREGACPLMSKLMMGQVTEALGNGAYKLRDMDGRELPRTWNVCNLKRCYL